MRFDQNEAFASVDAVEPFDATFITRRQRVSERETGEALVSFADKPVEVQQGREQPREQCREGKCKACWSEVRARVPGE